MELNGQMDDCTGLVCLTTEHGLVQHWQIMFPTDSAKVTSIWTIYHGRAERGMMCFCAPMLPIQRHCHGIAPQEGR